MKKTLIAALLATATAFTAESFAASKPDEAIRQVFARVDACLAKRDAKCVGELFTDDGTFAVPTGGAKIIKGRAQIIKALQEMLSESSMTGAKQKHVVESVRMIGEDHALVDCSVEIVAEKPREGATADSQPYSWHATGILVLKDGQWLLEDLRSYVVGPLRPVEPTQAPNPPPTVAPTPPAATPKT